MMINEKLPWKDTFDKETLKDKDFQKIFFFFTIYTPCTVLSCRGKSLESYGWESPWEEPYFLDKQLSSLTELEIYPAKKLSNLENELVKANLHKKFPLKPQKEVICIYTETERLKGENIFLHIFYHLRNAFAHGRFNVTECNGEQLFFFEDRSPRLDKEKNTYPISARMILRKSTLLKWIEIIEGGKKNFQNQANT